MAYSPVEFFSAERTCRVGYKTFRLGKWRRIREDTPQLECPVCECRVTEQFYLFAIGERGISFCPYCGVDLRTEQMSMEEAIGSA